MLSRGRPSSLDGLGDGDRTAQPCEISGNGGGVVTLGNLEPEFGAEGVALVTHVGPRVPEVRPALDLFLLQAGGAGRMIIQPRARGLAPQDGCKPPVLDQHVAPAGDGLGLEEVSSARTLARVGQGI